MIRKFLAVLSLLALTACSEGPSKPPFNALDLAPPRVVVEPQPGGGRILRSPIDLGQPARCLGDMLVHWAKKAPDRLFLAERAADGAWRRMTFGQVHAATRAVGQALLDRGLTPETPIAILSGNGIDNALLQLGAMQVGLAASAISPAYSLMSGDFGKLRHIYELLEPGLIYAADGAQFARAIAALRTLLERWPEHPLAPQARRLLQRLVGAQG